MTGTLSPVRGLRPVRAWRCLVEKAPKPRNSTRSPRAKRVGDLAENGVDDVFDVALIEMRVAGRHALHEFGLDHEYVPISRRAASADAARLIPHA